MVWRCGEEVVNLQDMSTAWLIILVVCFGYARGQRLSVERAGTHKAVRVEPLRSSGLESVYVVSDGEGLTLRYRPDGDGHDTRWLTF